MTENVGCRMCGPICIMPPAFYAFLDVYELSTIMQIFSYVFYNTVSISAYVVSRWDDWQIWKGLEAAFVA
jgi:hypothetical protein